MAARALYVGGRLDHAGGVVAPHSAKWRGGAWTGAGVTAPIIPQDWFVFDAGAGRALSAARQTFSDVSVGAPIVQKLVAGVWTDVSLGALYAGGRFDSVVGAPSIFATGVSSIAANNFRVKAANVINNKNGVCLRGFGPKSSPFQGGTLCVAPPTIRTPAQVSGGNAPPDDCSGSYSFHFSASYMTS